MSRAKTPASAAGEWMGKIADLFSSPDKNLDQVKKSVQADLEKLKRSTDTGASLYAAALAGFKKDLEEVKISGDKQDEFVALFKQEWDKMEMGKRSAEILESTELAAMNAFITKIENLPKLRTIIESAEPQSGWQMMLGKLTSRVPGLDKFVKEGGFNTVLTAMGLGFLVKKKEDKDKGGKQEAGQPAKPQSTEDKDKPADQREKREVRGKPKSTCFIGDSITTGMVSHCEALKGNNPLKIEGKPMTIAKGGMDTRWGIDQIRPLAEQKPSPLAEMENAVVLFGTNDIGVGGPEGTAEKIFERLEEIYELLTKAGVKRIYAVTVPPYGGYAAYDRRPDVAERRKKLNDLIRGSVPKRAGSTRKYQIYRIIDTCKTESEGGLADNSDPNRFCKSANGDWLHPSKIALAKLYQNELELGSGTPA